MKLMPILSGVLLLASCSSFKMPGREVECVAVYKMTLMEFKNDYPVEVDRVRVDRVGKKWVHVKPNLYIHFFNSWQSDGTFTNYSCKGQDI